DSTAPNSPVLVSTTPAVTSDINDITIAGTAEADSSVRIHKTSDCSDTVVTTATVDALGDFTASVSVLDNIATQFWATSRDASNNTSACSVTSVTYTAYSIPVGMAFLKSTTTSSGTNFN